MINNKHPTITYKSDPTSISKKRIVQDSANKRNRQRTGKTNKQERNQHIAYNIQYNKQQQKQTHQFYPQQSTTKPENAHQQQHHAHTPNNKNKQTTLPKNNI